jgi:uncharacterized protein YndB with AHSA1/START domain
LHRNEHTVEIDAPVERVFEYVAEPERMHEWVGGLLEFRPLGPGPALGARGVQVVHMAGRRWELESELTRYEPPRELEARLVHKDFESLASYRLEESNGRTRVTTTMETEYKQAFARLLAGVVTRQAQKKLEADLARLKQVVESAG